ncbi:iron complex outermembrane receptor protein [Yoonia maritima]|uniref:Iron complex outermembrane receptor protein n=1 Tax=Yoonia maritima TaxID=1435347 RepID=A0A2T0VV27_9RHOB|nr:TonB-dependent siderophore receptor [Yoonia maritima]PRY75470.1 iron complex outermembrane receptor protein [Yoonia maritima]
MQNQSYTTATQHMLVRSGLKIALLSCTAIAFPAAGFAQDTQSQMLGTITLDTASDEETVVASSTTSSSKTDTDLLDAPASVSVVTAKEVEARGAQNLEQVLSYTSGVMVNEWGGDDRYDAFRIRGFDQLANGTYRDGLPVRGEFFTFGRREPYAFERIEVLKGSNSSLFGLNAPGGLVNGVTKRPTGEAFAETYVTLGEDHSEVGADFGNTLNDDGSLSYRVTTKVQDGAYGYDYSTDDRRYLAVGLTYAPTNATTLTFLADYKEHDSVPGVGFSDTLDVDIDTFLGEPDFNKMDTVESNIGFQFDHDFGGGLSFGSTARYMELDLTYEQVYGATSDPTAARSAFAVDGHSEQFAIDNRLQYERSFGRVESQTLVGLEYTWFQMDEASKYGSASGIDANDPNYCGTACITVPDYIVWAPELKTTSLYVQEELTFDDRWIATLGGRYDVIDMASNVSYDVYSGIDTTVPEDTVEAFTKRFGLTYKATNDLSVYANYSESFQPNLTNISLESQEGEQYELGMKYRPAGMNALFTASIFDLTQTNVNTQVSPTESRQIGEVNVRGLELETKAEISNNFSLLSSYAYWDAEIVDDGIATNEGNRPARLPKHIASVWANYAIEDLDSLGDMNFGLGARFMGQTFGDDANTTNVKSYTVVDAAFGYAVTENVDLQLNVTNLFDTEYMTTSYYGSEYYGDGRTTRATLKYTW